MQSIGIDWKILIPQIVNFLILFFLLKWILYEPILKILDERRKKIEESMALAEKTKKESEELEQKIKNKIEEVRRDALAILEDAKKEGELSKKAIRDEADRESGFIMKKAEERIREQKQEMLADLRKETVNLTIATTEKILGKNLDKDSQEKLINDAIEKAE